MKSVCVTKPMRDKERQGRMGERALLWECWASGWAPALPWFRFSWSALVQADKMAPGKESTCPLNKFMIQKPCQRLSLKIKIYFSNSEMSQHQMLFFYTVEKHHKGLQMLIVRLYLILSVAWLVILNPIDRKRRYFLIYFPPLTKADC